jgi:hypothetical protein
MSCSVLISLHQRAAEVEDLLDPEAESRMIGIGA